MHFRAAAGAVGYVAARDRADDTTQHGAGRRGGAAAGRYDIGTLEDAAVGAVAVSYTHLDVYKRQGQFPGIEERRPVDQRDQLGQRVVVEHMQAGLLGRCLLYTSRCV